VTSEGSTQAHTHAASPSPDDAELVTRCRNGDEAAWRVLVARHAPLVHGILRGAFRLPTHEAEDLFQEVFTRLYVRLGSIRDGHAVRGWIAQVTRTVALDWLRRSGRETATGESLDDHAYEEPMRAVDEALSVRAALERLPESQREVLDRFFARDESYQTIAAALGIPPGTIASRISRALVALRAEFDQPGRSTAAGASS
jgi:RNA polymerase sigma factor (sigma-70 family)